MVPGMLVASLISAILGNILPGPGTLYRSKSLQFHQRAHAGDEVIGRVRVLSKDSEDEVTCATEVCRTRDGAVLVQGQAVVQAPQRKYQIDDLEVPGLIVQRHRHFEALVDKARPLPSLVVAVVCPEEEKSLEGALLAAREGIISPILIGNRQRIKEAASTL